jgi:peptide/nickel transport system substrate-binding protein
MKDGDLGDPGHEALKDVNVRRAIRLGIDREKLVKEALGGLASVADDLYDQTQWKSSKIEFVKYDPAAAEKLLDDAGWTKGADGIREKDGKKLEFSYISTTAAQRKANQAIIQQDLAKIGIKVNLDNKPAAEFFAPYTENGIMFTGKFDLAEFANNTVTTNPANATVRALMTCMEVVVEGNEGGQSNGGYCNPDLKIDELQLTTEQSLDQKESNDAVAKIQEIFSDEVPFIILYNRDDIYAYVTSRFVGTPKIGTGILNMWFDVHNWDVK